ncbi:MAG: excinuclease ABC subunit UvrC [Chitinophagaceae bacterium]
MHPAYAKIAETLPNLPGIYKYYNEANELLYVGKAKQLKKRVASYFTKTLASYKTHELVQKISTIEFTIVNTEQDALLLENSLIKQFQPKYNIDLKDDKTYPYIVIKKEPFPRIFFTRKKFNDGSEYLGPFTSVAKARDLLYFVKQIIPLRTCKLALTENNIAKKKFKVCLEYHLGNCKGPCQALQNQEDYNNALSQVKEILKGNVSGVIQLYKKEMKAYAINLEFEKAEQIKKKIDYLETYQEKSVIVNKTIGNVDVFSIVAENNIAFVNFLMLQNGTIIHTHTVQVETKLDETIEETLAFSIQQIRDTFNSTNKEVIVPFEISNYGDNTVQFTIPKVGDKKKLLNLSFTNTNYFKLELKKQKALNLPIKSNNAYYEVLKELQINLHLKQLPTHIECFDNSNFQGSFPVSAMVCFKDGMPSKENYRHYNVKTVVGINDFATMSEVVLRRYTRLLTENKPLPQLVIIDGGKGQLGAAMESIRKLDLQHEITLVGLAKNEEEIFFAGDTQSIKLPWDSDSLKLVRRIRDEVHRFGITFHRNQRSKGVFKTELQEIEGIGKASIDALMQQFKSVKNIKSQSFENLKAIVGESKAKILVKAFVQLD